ncbi:MAG TPA: cytochrome c3 family protein [Bryobacteraceae bacterium]|nr:cytochrome c3 family protein [Bryobacteraceae bacterium]
MRWAQPRSLVWALAVAGTLSAADTGPVDKRCLSCHDSAKLASLKKDGIRGPEIIPEDPKEREDFAALMAANDAHQRKALAESFVQAYPASWMLEPAYEIASKASIAVGDFPAALDYGARSLRFLPENPFLLVALAGARVRMGQLDGATLQAQDALWFLSRFDRPSSIEDRNWPGVQARIRSQAYYLIGQVAAIRAQEARDDTRAKQFGEAEAALREALRLDNGTPATAYLLGMVILNQGRLADGARFLAIAAKPEGPVHQQALDRLRTVYADIGAPGGRSFEAWSESLDTSLPPSASPAQRASQARTYAGSAACKDCHAQQHSNWQATGMSRMFRAYRPKDVIGDFTSGQPVLDDAGKPVARAVLRNERHYMEIRAGNVWKSYPVDYLIGSKWQQGYATKLPGGEMQVFPLQYNVAHKSWVNYWEIKDPANSARTDVSRFHEIVPGATYQLECAVCHTSQQRFENGEMEAKASSFREGGVNCEMCHGPSAAHVAAMRAGRPYPKGAADPPIDFSHVGASEYVAICAQCHMQTGLRDPEPAGALNYSESGAKFYRELLSRPYVDYSRRGFYKDGRFRETVFIVESFVRSACFRKGGATCGNCHDPHPADAASNPRSLKFGADSDRMCLGCHKQFAAKPEGHTHHAAASEAGRCVSCHMPRIMNALMFQARYHQIDDIPDAEMTARFGPQDSPNACLICHKDRDAAWLQKSMQSWKPNLAFAGRKGR